MIGALPDGLQTNPRLPAGERLIRTRLERHIENAFGPALPHRTQSLWRATQT